MSQKISYIGFITRHSQFVILINKAALTGARAAIQNHAAFSKVKDETTNCILYALK